MRNGQNKQRMRNNRGGGGGGGHNQNRRGGQNPLTRVYESNGPEIKIRGTASHIAEKYLQLARDAQSSGDPVSAENYFQHAEHYFRIIAAAQEQFRQNQPQQQPQQRVDNDTRDENADDSDGEFSSFGNDQSGQPREAQPYPTREPQPYQMREQNQPPREQQNWRDNRNENRGDNRGDRNDNRNDNRNQPPQQPAVSDDRDIDRLPSFITGGQQQPNFGGNTNYDNGGNSERNNNGGDRGDRGDRYPHRRRRRHHNGPRPDNQMSQPASNDDFGSGGD